jgi:hypothetical protein
MDRNGYRHSIESPDEIQRKEIKQMEMKDK